MVRYSGLVVATQTTPCGGRLVGVDANVVDEHFCGELCGGVGSFGPVAANGEVEQEEEGVAIVEGPDGAGTVEVGWGVGGVDVGGRVDVEAGFSLRPGRRP